MKTLKVLFFLLIVGVQANATGYAHNMFVAHQKLRTGKECVVKVKSSTRKPQFQESNLRKGPVMILSQSPVQQIAEKVTAIATLNERILDESPKFLFANDQEKESEESLVAMLIGMVKSTLCAFAASLTIRG
jgi:hypothetical protein